MSLTSRGDLCYTGINSKATRRPIMKKILAAVAGMTIAAAGFLGGLSAGASGTTIQTVSQVEHMANSHCYTTHRVTTTYYEWSKTHGWELYPSPKVTTTNSETCH